MEFIKGFFRENSLESNIRLCVFIVTINACGLAWYGMMQNKPMDTIVLGMLGLALAGKVFQKNKETKE
jgi:hypothetical protein